MNVSADFIKAFGACISCPGKHFQSTDTERVGECVFQKIVSGNSKQIYTSLTCCASVEIRQYPIFC